MHTLHVYMRKRNKNMNLREKTPTVRFKPFLFWACSATDEIKKSRSGHSGAKKMVNKMVNKP